MADVSAFQALSAYLQIPVAHATGRGYVGLSGPEPRKFKTESSGFGSVNTLRSNGNTPHLVAGP